RISIVAIALILAMVTTTFAALFDRMSRGLGIAAIIACVVCVIVSDAMPVATNERPRAIDLSYLDDDTHAEWIATSRILLTLHEKQTLFPWYAFKSDYYGAPAPKLPIAHVDRKSTRLNSSH